MTTLINTRGGTAWNVQWKKCRADFIILSRESDLLLIKDIGPWDSRPTVTNDAEAVIEALANLIGNRRVEYIDSEGNRDQLLVKDGKFAGFAPAGENHG